jgi:hypothetical protein
MTEENKSIFIEDLCGRLPYGVQCRYSAIVPLLGGVVNIGDLRAIDVKQEQFNVCGHLCMIGDLKPFLRPLSSMTDDEKKELMDLCDITPYETQGLKIDEYGIGVFLNGVCSINYDVMTWLNKHHFDYRGLIEKGLAYAALNNMYVEEKQN